MENIKINCNITSQQTSVSFETLGEYKNNRIKFVDQDDVVNYVLIKEDKIEYYKKGEIDMKYIFDLDLVTKGYYKVVGTEFHFDIVTNDLTVEDDLIFVKYDLYQDEELVNSAEISLVFETKEES